MKMPENQRLRNSIAKCSVKKIYSNTDFGCPMEILIFYKLEEHYIVYRYSNYVRLRFFGNVHRYLMTDFKKWQRCWYQYVLTSLAKIGVIHKIQIWYVQQQKRYISQNLTILFCLDLYRFQIFFKIIAVPKFSKRLLFFVFNWFEIIAFG